MIRVSLAGLLAALVSQPAAAAETAVDPPWRYTFEQPADGRAAEGFDDGGWRKGPGGFGDGKAIQSRVATEGKTAVTTLSTQ